jgi:cytochrome P450 family 6
MSFAQLRFVARRKMFVFILIALIFLLSLAFNRRQFQYWKRRGIAQSEQQTFLAGDFRDLLLQRKSLADFFADLHWRTRNEKIFGLYFTYNPMVLINDYSLAKRILNEDFHHFGNRGLLDDEKIDKLVGNVFCLSDEKWKNLRQKITPLFSSLRLKQMMPIIEDSVATLEEFIDRKCRSGEGNFKVKDISSRFTMTLISSLAFGIVNDSINQPENVFNQMSLRVSGIF